MKKILGGVVILLALSWGTTTFFWGCSSPSKKGAPAPAAKDPGSSASADENPAGEKAAPGAAAPALAGLAHPAGNDIGDIDRLFLEKNAPDRESLKDCDADFKKLIAATQSREEIEQGANEFVRLDPVKFHWCFFSKILDLEKLVKKDVFLDERQKTVLDIYAFLSPIARGFLTEFHDSRYLRWAVNHYRKLSETVFFRRVEMNQEMTANLVQAENPFEGYRAPAGKTPVLDKYKIVIKPEAPTRVYPTPESAPLKDSQAIDPSEVVKNSGENEKKK